MCSGSASKTFPQDLWLLMKKTCYHRDNWDSMVTNNQQRDAHKVLFNWISVFVSARPTIILFHHSCCETAVRLSNMHKLGHPRWVGEPGMPIKPGSSDLLTAGGWWVSIMTQLTCCSWKLVWDAKSVVLLSRDHLVKQLYSRLKQQSCNMPGTFCLTRPKSGQWKWVIIVRSMSKLVNLLLCLSCLLSKPVYIINI